MIKSENTDSLRKLLEPALQQLAKRPEVQVLEMEPEPDDAERTWFGRYLVEGSQTFYNVVCGQGVRDVFISCGCVAGLNNRPCYHAAAAFLFHCERQAEQAAENRPYLKPDLHGKTTKVGKIRI